MDYLNLSSQEIKDYLYPSLGSNTGFCLPDYQLINEELKKPGVNLTLLWTEYKNRCIICNEKPYQYTQFIKHYADYSVTKKATMNINHKPGVLMEADWAGTLGSFFCLKTKKIETAHFFVLTLVYSGYSYIEAFIDEKIESWIQGHINGYTFFGGSTIMLVPDNLKCAIIKNTTNEIIFNKTYNEMAEHYKTAIDPARIRHPKDKPTVEKTVGIITTWIIAALRDRQFYSLSDYNKAINEKLLEFLNKPFQKKSGSRNDYFNEEKKFLQEIPHKPFEISTWVKATVQYNYHICCEKNFYSVPYEYIKKLVDIRLTYKFVEVYFESSRIALHSRIHGKTNQYSTIDEHMTNNHKHYSEWNADRYKSWAQDIGVNTFAVINIIIKSRLYEQQSYKSCMAVLSLSKKFSKTLLEEACSISMERYTYQSFALIENIILQLNDKKKLENDSLIVDLNKVSPSDIVRGSNYYKGIKDNVD